MNSSLRLNNNYQVEKINSLSKTNTKRNNLKFLINLKIFNWDIKIAGLINKKNDN